MKSPGKTFHFLLRENVPTYVGNIPRGRRRDPVENPGLIYGKTTNTLGRTGTSVFPKRPSGRLLTMKTIAAIVLALACGVLVGGKSGMEVTWEGVVHSNDHSLKDYVITINGVAFKMIAIPAGTFTMGSPVTEVGRGDDEVQHQVTISEPFYISETPVTQKLWTVVMGLNPSSYTVGTNLPVHNVTPVEARKFAMELEEITGRPFRLPTEAQWEYACRAGTTGPRYASLSEINWRPTKDGIRPYLPVATGRPNPWGLYDMLGGGFEWCNDWYLGPYSPSPVSDPTGFPMGGYFRTVVRGGFGDDPTMIRSAGRGACPPNIQNPINFVRLVATALGP